MYLARFAAAALLALPLAQLQNEKPPVVTTETEAFLLMPPEIVAAPTIIACSPSPDGHYVLVARQSTKVTSKMVQDSMAGGPPPTVETKLILWDNVGRTARDVWHSNALEVQIRETWWFPSGRAALMIVKQTFPPDLDDAAERPTERWSLLRVAGGQVVDTDLGENPMVGMQMSPVKQVAILRQDTGHEWSISTIDDAGRSAPVALPGGEYPSNIEWLVDGSPLIHLGPHGPAQEGAPDRRFLLDVKTGVLRAVGRDDKLTMFEPKEPKLAPFKFKVTSATVSEGEEKHPVSALWMIGAEKTEFPRALVAADCPGGQFLEKGDTVLYPAGGALWVRPLVRLPREALVRGRREAEKTECMSNGKQIGLALIMYANDNDDGLPPEGDPTDAIWPYVKSREVFQGFHYTFHSGQAGPTDELGYVSGPGGRAVLFGDGHVEWRDDK